MRNPRAIRIVDGLLAGIVIIIIFAIAGCSDVQDNAAVPTLMSLSSSTSDMDVVEKSAGEPHKIESPQIPAETSAIIQPGADSIPSERTDSTDAFSETTTILQPTAPGVNNAISMETNAGSGPPVIVTQPANQVILSGETATLTVAVDGTEPFTYQWYEGMSGDTSAPVGMDSPSYTTPALTTTTSYWVRITNALGSVDSNTATISVSGVSIIQITDTSAASSEWGDTGILNGDGSRMVFSTNADLTGENADGNLEVFLWDQFADDFRQLSNTDNGFLSSAPFISNRGGAVVFHSNGQMSYNPEGVYQIFKWDQSDPYYAYSPQEIYLSQSHDSMSPFVSDDGKKVIFKSTAVNEGSNPDGNFEIFLKNLDPYSVTQITNTSVTNVNSPTDITPDGTHIAFMSNANLADENADGSEEVFLWDETDGFTQITNSTGIYMDGGPVPMLDNSGTQMVFHSDRDLVSGSNPDGNWEVFRWEDGFGLIQITNTTTGNSYGPFISGDGNRIAFVSTSDLAGENSDGSQEVFLWDETTGFHQLTSSASAVNVVTSINDDGTRIAFSSDGDLTGDNSDGNREIFLVTVLAAPTVIGQPDEQIINSGGTATLQVKVVGNLPLHYQWYQGAAGDTSIPVGTDSQFLTVAGLTATTQYWVRITNDVGVTDSAAPVTVYTESSTCSIQQMTDLEAGITLESASISTDGTRIAFKSTADLTGENSDNSQELFLWDQVEGFTQITHDQTVNGVKISGNGTRIVVNTKTDLTGGNGDNNTEIFLWAEGDGFTQITDTLDSAYEDNQHTSISNDGTRIAFESTADLTSSGATGGQFYLWEEGVGFTQITNQSSGCGGCLRGQISGDGLRVLIFTQVDLLGSNPEGNQEFYLWDETSGLSQLTNFTTDWITNGSIDNAGDRVLLFSYWPYDVPKQPEYPELTLWDEGVGFTQITGSTLYGVFGGAISGDGQHMAFLSNADLTGENPDNYQQLFLWEQSSGFTQITHTSYHLFIDAYLDGDGSRLVMVGPDDLTGDNPDGSDELFLVICDEAPEIIIQPYEQIIGSGGTAILQVKAVGNLPLHFQWYQGVTGDTSVPVGTDSQFLTVSGLTTTTQYWVRITNNVGVTDSVAAPVTVSPESSSVCSISQLTDLEADTLLYDASISTDGTRIAFKSTADLTGENTDYSTELFLWDQVDGFTQITHDQGVYGVYISGDGTHIVLELTSDPTGGNSDGNGEVFVWAEGDGFTQITDTLVGEDEYNGDVSINDDGTRVAFRSTADLTDSGSTSGQIYLWEEGVGFTQTTNQTDGCYQCVDGQISGDGSRVLIWTQSGFPENKIEFYLWDETNGLSQITDNTDYLPYGGGTISGDGSRAILYFYMLWPRTMAGEYELTLWEDGIGLDQITSSTLYETLGGDISGNGQRITFASRGDLTGENPDNYLQIFLWEQGGGFTQITHLSDHVASLVLLDGDGSRLAMAGADDLTGGNPDFSDELFLVICDETPEIITQPANQTIFSGETATLTVKVIGTAPFTYQWYEGIAGDTSMPVGTDSPSYTTPTLTTTTPYWIRITNGLGNVDSATATVTITSPFCATVSEIPANECMALEALYTSTTGTGWTYHTGWMDTNTPCIWYGVSCDAGHVTGIRLDYNELSGSLPASLSDLSYLASFVVENNQLTGPIPVSLGSLTNLLELDLGFNQFSGNIPVELGNLTNLSILDLTFNQLSGSIPPELGNLTNLTVLSLDVNQLTGTIPAELSNLTNLQNLYLGSNQLTGTIPAWLGDLSQLRFLFLHDNQLTGSIPPELGDLPDLVMLLLSNNQLSGTIPPELGNPPLLLWLFLGDNLLSGTIPPELGNLTHLDVLMLQNNHLTGNIPTEIGNLTGLRSLFVQNNALSGEIPASIVNLIDLDTGDNFPNDPPFDTFYDEVDFGYNKLYSTNQDVIDFLDVKDPDWAQTQTIPPANIQVDTVTMDSVTLAWNPIPYTGDGGYYQIYFAQNIAGPYTLHGSTPNKSVSSYQAGSLFLGTTYYFQVLTVTPAHGDQQNSLYTGFSPAVEATTLTLSTFCESVSQIPRPECEALVSLYIETNGTGWTDNTNWLDTFTPCDWHGVGCTAGHVTGINLSVNGLHGVLPAQLGDFPELTSLILYGNNMTGSTIPSELGDLANLQVLNLQTTHVSGSIPPELGELVNLTDLNLGDNQLSGSIPPALGNLSELVVFDLSENLLTGSIPPELGNLSHVYHLLLYDNQLTGSIPPQIGSLSHLEALLLQNNRLMGTIPSEFGSLANLKALLLQNNALSGEVPVSIVNLTQLGTEDILPMYWWPGDDEVDFGYNMLISTDQDVIDFLNTKDPDWAQTQTIIPDNIQVDTVTVDSVSLTWDTIPYTGDGGFYEVHYATTPGGPYTLHGQTPSKSATGYDAGGLLPGTTYYFVVRTYTPAHGSQQNALTTDFSAEVMGTTDIMGLNAPTGLVAVAVSQTQIDLSWRDNSSDETAFLLQRSLTGVSGWEDIPALGADTTTYSDTSLTCHTRYYYRVRAYRDGDGQTSAFSNIASAVTNLCPAPDAPTNLTATPASLTEISLSWVDNSDETAFHIERSLYGVNWTEIATVSAEQTTFTNGGLACSATFRYRVRAYRAGDGQYSEYSNVVVGSTQVCLPPNQPGLYSVTGTGIDRIHIVWADNSIDETAFMVEHSPDGSSGWEQIAMLPANQNSYTHVGLPCHTTHYYRVRAYRSRDNQYSIYSVVMGTSTQACPPATTATVGLYQNGLWQFRDSNSTGPADLYFAFGPAQPDWTPVVGDWDGDGVDGIGVYKDGMWMLRNSATSGQMDIAFIFNPLGTGAIPVVGDWNRDGIDTIGVYKEGMWVLRNINSGGNYDHAFIFNPAGTGAVPITGDWDGDGIDTAGIYKNSAWYLNNSHTSVDRAGGFIYGPDQSSNWLPVIGDWNEDGFDSIGLYRDGIWRLRNNNSAGAPDIGFVFGDGYTGWKPVAGYRGGLSGLMALGLSEAWLPAEPTVAPSVIPSDEAIPAPPTSTPLPTAAPELTETVEPTEIVTPTPTAIPPTNTPEPTATLILPTDTPVLPTATPIPEVTGEPSGN